MRSAMNESMAALLKRVVVPPSIETLPPDLARLARAGVVRVNDSVRLAGSQLLSPVPADLDDCSAERWANEVYFESTLPASDPAWRIEIVQWGRTLAHLLLSSAAQVIDLPVQACLSLQSAPGQEDDEFDFPVGALHLYCVRCSADDLSLTIDQAGQPVLVMTVL